MPISTTSFISLKPTQWHPWMLNCQAIHRLDNAERLRSNNSLYCVTKLGYINDNVCLLLPYRLLWAKKYNQFDAENLNMNLLFSSIVEILLFVLASSRPALRQIVTVGEIPSEARQCVKFNNTVCNQLGGHGYSYAMFPNPLAPAYLPNVQTAESEGNAVIKMAVDSKCSPNVAMFLCFAFFPLCTENRPPVLPCMSLCEQVRRDCEPYLNSTFGVRWPQWADCSNIDKVISERKGECVKETPAATPPPVCETCSLVNKVYSTTFRLSNSNLAFGKCKSIIKLIYIYWLAFHYLIFYSIPCIYSC